MDTNTDVNQGLPQRRPPWTFNLSSCSHTTVFLLFVFLRGCPRASPSSKVLLLSSHYCPLAFLCLYPQMGFSSLRYVVAANPQAGEEPPSPLFFLCAYAILMAVSCLVLVPAQDRWVDQSAATFLFRPACQVAFSVAGAPEDKMWLLNVT